MLEDTFDLLIKSVASARVLNPSGSPLDWLPSSTRPAARHARRVIFAELSTLNEVAERSGVPLHILASLIYVCLANGLTTESKAQCGECWISRRDQQSRFGITGLPRSLLEQHGLPTAHLPTALCIELGAERLAAFVAQSFGPPDWEIAFSEFCRNPEGQNDILRAA